MNAAAPRLENASDPEVARVPTGNRRVLVATLAALGGGVTTMLGFVIETLRAGGYEPVLAYYSPYSLTPELSVPSFRLFARSVKTRTVLRFGNTEAHEMGAWLPELEFTHYLPTRSWRDLMESCPYRVAVSGSALAAAPFALTHSSFLLWVATPWMADRVDRVKSFPWIRRVLDVAVVRPVATLLEKTVLSRGTILALSDYTRDRIDAVQARPVVRGVMASPIDTDRFRTDQRSVVPGRVAFVGRLKDPRKNVRLLVEALALCHRRGQLEKALLIGGEPGPEIHAQIAAHGLAERIEIHPFVEQSALPALLATVDVFALPSAQEGLCLAALEAMACGAPVVSTRCGGPEEFVIPGQTGFLTGFDAAELADAIGRVVSDRALRSALSSGARTLIEERYSRARAASTFWEAFHATYPEDECRAS